MADILDVLSLSEAKTALDIGLGDITELPDLERLITTVSRRLDRWVGPIVQRVVSNERHETSGMCSVELSQGPVASVSSVTAYLGTTATFLSEEIPGTQPSDGWYGERYKPDPSLYSGIIHRRSGGWDHPFGHYAVVTYTAGRFTDTATVDSRFREAAVLMLRNLWRPKEISVGVIDSEFDIPNQNFPTFAVPKVVRQLLSDVWQSEIGFGA